MGSNQFNYRRQIQTTAYGINSNNKQHCRGPPIHSYQGASMNADDMAKMESLDAMWSATSQHSRSRPSTIHETGFSYCMPEDYPPMPAWDSSTMPMQSMTDGLPRTYVQSDYYASPGIGNHGWMPKSHEDTMDMQGVESDMHLGAHFATDEMEKFPMLDLRYSGQGLESDTLGLESAYNPRRLSGSSFTMSTNGGLSEMPSYEDFSASLSEAPSFTSDYPPTSNRNSLMSSTQLSPVASPRMTPQGLVRTASRGRASPSPRPNMRSAPYSIDGSQRGPKRWSTGSYAAPQNRRPSPFIYNQPPSFDSLNTRMSSRHSSPTLPQNPVQLNITNLQGQQQHPFLMNNNAVYHRNSMILPSSHYHEQPQFSTPPPLLSHGMFRMLQSNASPHSMHGHYADLSDPPDLYASIHEEQLSPPESDMNPEDPDLVPHEQELRFDGDLYTPRWVRGHGNKREGWCGICKPGRWLVLKNSAFWYDKSFTHGISAATGSPFQEPVETRRMDGNPDVWEGLCGSCGDWVALVSSKKKGTTWFRHAYKCHTHPKIKDAPKRRRESSHARAAQAAQSAGISTPKTKIERPRTPHSASDHSLSGTPTPGSSIKVTRTAMTPASTPMTLNMI